MTHGSALHVRTYGPADAPPVLVLHGVTGHCGRWRVLADALPQLRLVAVDLRGHGRSPWTPPWGLEQHVADALGVLDDLGAGRIPVLGHSFGGAIAVHLARTAPERVARLVLLDPALGLDPQLGLQNATDAGAGESWPDRESARADRAARWAGVPGERVDAELDEHLECGADGRWRYRYAPPAVAAAWGEMTRPALTPPPDLPTLLVPATKADFVAPAWVERLRIELGDRLVVTPMDTGHMVYLERPGETAAAIRDFLR